jgi:PPOX class probable FMN-dependent enzyme
MIYPQWRQQLVRSLHVHRSKPEAKYFQAANVTSNGIPKVRTMVFRGFAENTSALLAVTDSRSEKVSEWRSSLKSELHWYFVKSREQYRILCDVTVVCQDNDEALEIVGEGYAQTKEMKQLYSQQWQHLSKRARSGFFCPPPKSAIDYQQNSEDEDAGQFSSDETTSEQTISQHFALLIFAPYQVDYLDLKTSPHTRILYSLRNQHWQSKSVNP